MILMEKDGMKKFVPDVFVESYKKDGFTVVGEDCAQRSSLNSEASMEDKNSEPESSGEQPEEEVTEQPSQKKASQNHNKPSKV